MNWFVDTMTTDALGSDGPRQFLAFHYQNLQFSTAKPCRWKVSGVALRQTGSPRLASTEITSVMMEASWCETKKI